MFLGYLRFYATVLLINIHIWLFSESGSNFEQNGLFIFLKIRLSVFSKISVVKKSKKNFFLISVESIPFDAEADESEIYMVPFGSFWFFAFILILTVIFEKKDEIP